ncbi:MAG: hypothetical protein EO766_12080 [Hydrotalea sp. AMD]|uniref:zinc-ribbon domain-containing protein n=1 Tax=Hydrotalea sp. AMD TaxID=2501297 RepID=UPI0010262FC0|nr:hypothetical protein [Hydrotalea sp. AMD]RWZ87256.1 MAG: hypothetical protein EO766_12080 [Hydrotalea sp. AMD]
MKKSNLTEFINKANLKHNNKYDYSLVKYINAVSPVTIVCLTHGQFNQTPNSHLTGNGCPECGGTKRSSTSDFIDRSKLIHNNKYDYSLVEYINTSTKVSIHCPIHGIFEQTPKSHLIGNGCARCAGVSRMTNDEFVTRSCKIHNNTYDYSLIEYTNTHTRVKIKCNIHGIFEQTPAIHLGGSGCPQCGQFNSARNTRCNNDEFDKKLLSSNRGVIRVGDYIQSHTPILVKCSICNHEWKAKPTKLLGTHATGCPQCRRGVFGTFVEYDGIKFHSILEKDCYIIMTEYCQLTNQQMELQKKYPQSNTNHTCDFYLPKLKLWIEVSGIKTEKYKSRMQQKINWVNELKENFLFSSNPQQLKELLNGTIYLE